MVDGRGLLSSPPGYLSASSRSRSGRSLSSLSTANSSSRAENDKPDTSVHLNVAERWWRAHQPWLERCGYLLRPRYGQDWVPSWERKGIFSGLRAPEDAIELPAMSRMIDATRKSDGLPVHLHLVSEKKSPEEADIMLYLTSGRSGAEDDGENHTIPVFEVLDVDDNCDLCVIVTPLMRACDDPWFESMGEAVNFLGQVLEGMKFMHAQGVAHRNPQLNGDAIMYDPTPCYPEGFHPVVTKMNRCLTSGAFRYSRTMKPVTYYFADLQAAKRYHTHPTSPTTHHRTQQATRTKRRRKSTGKSTVRDYPLLWKNNFAPEFRRPEKKCDPFKVDVYLLGVEISRQFLKKYRGFEWLRPLIDDMCRENPKLRITAAESYVRFLWLSASIDSADLEGELISTRKRGATQHVIRKWEKKLHVRTLLREMGFRDDATSMDLSPTTTVSWLPVHTA